MAPTAGLTQSPVRTAVRCSTDSRKWLRDNDHINDDVSFHRVQAPRVSSTLGRLIPSFLLLAALSCVSFTSAAGDDVLVDENAACTRATILELAYEFSDGYGKNRSSPVMWTMSEMMYFLSAPTDAKNDFVSFLKKSQWTSGLIPKFTYGAPEQLALSQLWVNSKKSLVPGPGMFLGASSLLSEAEKVNVKATPSFGPPSLRAVPSLVSFPIHAPIALELYAVQGNFSDYRFLSEIFQPLYRYHEYLFENRTGILSVGPCGNALPVLTHPWEMPFTQPYQPGMAEIFFEIYDTHNLSKDENLVKAIPADIKTLFHEAYPKTKTDGVSFEVFFKTSVFLLQCHQKHRFVPELVVKNCGFGVVDAGFSSQLIDSTMALKAIGDQLAKFGRGLTDLPTTQQLVQLTTWVTNAQKCLQDPTIPIPSGSPYSEEYQFYFPNDIASKPPKLILDFHTADSLGVFFTLTELIPNTLVTMLPYEIVCGLLAHIMPWSFQQQACQSFAVGNRLVPSTFVGTHSMLADIEDRLSAAGKPVRSLTASRHEAGRMLGVASQPNTTVQEDTAWYNCGRFGIPFQCPVSVTGGNSWGNGSFLSDVQPTMVPAINILTARGLYSQNFQGLSVYMGISTMELTCTSAIHKQPSEYFAARYSALDGTPSCGVAASSWVGGLSEVDPCGGITTAAAIILYNRVTGVMPEPDETLTYGTLIIIMVLELALVAAVGVGCMGISAFYVTRRGRHYLSKQPPPEPPHEFENGRAAASSFGSDDSATLTRRMGNNSLDTRGSHYTELEEEDEVEDATFTSTVSSYAVAAYQWVWPPAPSLRSSNISVHSAHSARSTDR